MTQSPKSSFQSPVSSPPDLYALIVRLVATQAGTLRATQGHLAHAAFLNILDQVDPPLAQTIHDINGRKPFTLSPLHGFGHGRYGKLHLKAGQEGWLRITLLDPVLFQTFIRHFLEGLHQPTLQLDPLTFQVTEILSTPGSHALADTTSLAQLETHWQMIPDAKIGGYRTIPLHFRTPTAFSLRDPAVPHRNMHVLPDPPLVFGEAAGYWDRLTGSVTQDAVREYAAYHVVVARHDIKTHMYQFRRSKQIGFAGHVTFKILDEENPDFVQHLNRMADLMFFTGVGSKTTMGMGQVTRMQENG